MALTANLPVIEDLAIKFNRHSLHDRFQLPNFYQYPNWQAKEFALYFQPNHGFPCFDEAGTPFEFSACGNFTTKRNNRNKVQTDRANNTRHSPRRHGVTTEQPKASKPQTLDTNPSNICTDNKEIPRKSKAVKTLDFDDDILSEDEELSCYFPTETEHFNDRFARKPSPSIESSPTRSHNRKRSMEDEECTNIKRCCRPRLNFDKMLLNSRDSSWTIEKNTTNYFRPISPQDLLL